MTSEEQKVRSRLRSDYEEVIDDCIDIIRSFLADFDEMHLLRDTKRFTTKISKVCEAQAKQSNIIITNYLRTLCGGHLSLIIDEQYPIERTLLNNHSRIANQIVLKVSQKKAQTDDNFDMEYIIDFIRSYMERAFKHASDAVLLYEATRVRTDAILADAPKDAFFRTICEHDELTCPVCLGIEAEQARHPVPVSQKMTGMNAPPFHPFCRCHVEVIEP